LKSAQKKAGKKYFEAQNNLRSTNTVSISVFHRILDF